MIEGQTYKVEVRVCTNSDKNYDCTNVSKAEEAIAQLVPKKDCEEEDKVLNTATGNCEEPDPNPSEDPGNNPGEDPGENPGDEPGDEPGEDPEDPGEDPKCPDDQFFDDNSGEAGACVPKLVCKDDEEWQDDNTCTPKVDCGEGKEWDDATEQCVVLEAPDGDIKELILTAYKFAYNGKAHTPGVTVKGNSGNVLNADTDYTVNLQAGRTAIGKYAVTAVGAGDYAGNLTKYFSVIPAKTSIKKATPASSSIKLELNAKSGGVSYQIAYKRAVDSTYKIITSSDATKTISGLSSGTKYNIKVRAYKTVGGVTYYSSSYSSAKSYSTTGKAKIAKVTLSTTKYTYNNAYKKPSVTVLSSKNKKIGSSGYTVSYPNSNKGGKAVGVYNVTVKGKGDYTGSKTASFTINPPNGSISSVSTGKNSAKVSVKAPSNNPGGTIHYQVEYKKSAEAESAYVKVNSTSKSISISNLTAGTQYSFRLRVYKVVNKTSYYSSWSGVTKKNTVGSSAISISNGAFSITPTATTYTGKAISVTPTLVVNGLTLKNGTHYIVSYSNNKNVGTATIKLTGKENYYSTISKTFKIQPKGTSISKFANKKKNQFDAVVKSVSGVTGYQYRYKKHSASSYSSAAKCSKTTCTVKSLSKSTKYDIQVRTYQKVSGTNYYSSWSTAKSITTAAK